MGTGDPDHVAGRDDGLSGPRPARRRRGPRPHLVATDEPHRKTPNPDPDRRRRRRSTRARAREGPQGRAVAGRLAGPLDRARGLHAAGQAADRPRGAPRAARPHAEPDLQHGRGRHQRLREAPRDPGRRLPRAAEGQHLELALGFSHPVRVDAPEGIDFEVPVPTQIIVRGIDKQAVGEIAARIRKLRPPEPYKGKGVRYAGEYVAARWASAHDDRDHREARAPPRAAAAGSARGWGHGRAPAAVGVPLEPRRGRAADRRRARHTLASVRWFEPELRDLKPMEQANRAGELLGGARQGGRGRGVRLRSRRLQVPRAREGARGRARAAACASRRRPGRFEDQELSSTLTDGRDRESPPGPRPPGARGRDQPRREGGQGRPPLLVHRAGRGRATRTRSSASATARRTRSRSRSRRRSSARRRASSGCRSTAQTITHQVIGRYGSGPGAAEAGLRGNRRDRRRRCARCSSWPASRTCCRRASAPRTRSTSRRRRSTGLPSLRRPEDVAELRGKTVAEVLGLRRRPRATRAKDGRGTRRRRAGARDGNRAAE